MAEAVGLAMEEKSGAGSGEKLGLEPSVWLWLLLVAMATCRGENLLLCLFFQFYANSRFANCTLESYRERD